MRGEQESRDDCRRRRIAMSSDDFQHPFYAEGHAVRLVQATDEAGRQRRLQLADLVGAQYVAPQQRRWVVDYTRDRRPSSTFFYFDVSREAATPA